MSIVKITEFENNGFIYKIGDVIDYLRWVNVDKTYNVKESIIDTFEISIIWKDDKGIYLGMKNPITHEYYGNSGYVHETEIYLTKKPYYLNRIRTEKIKQLSQC